MHYQNLLMGENVLQLPVGAHEEILRESYEIILKKGDNLLDIHRYMLYCGNLYGKTGFGYAIWED